MCDCLKETKEKIREKTGDPQASIDLDFIIQNNAMMGVPRITARYRKKNKKGEFNSKETAIPILPNFCPFCGIKYNN